VPLAPGARLGAVRDRRVDLLERSILWLLEMKVKMMLRILPLFLLSIIASSLTFGQELAKGDPAHAAGEEVRRLQDALIEAYIHRDVIAMDRILADEYTFINDDAGGVANKNQILDSFNSGGDRQIISYKREDDNVRVYGDVAVLTYRYQSKETYKGQDNSGDYRVTRIFVKRDGRWQILSGQETRVPNPNPGLDAQRFLGAWRTLSVTDTRPDGTEVPDLYLGAHPVGLLIYEATGHMCSGRMNPDRARWTDGSSGTPTEMAAAAQGYDTICGTYEINAGRKTVIFHIQVALVPNDVGTDLVLTYEFSGNQLKLSGTDGLKSGFKFWTVTFEHATPTK
jgi:Lipocalin-like domain/Domain of unknown function (DUF4440)